jgi:copper chaperone CopZ
MPPSTPMRSMAGALTSALLASLCCAGPLVTAALGLGGAAGLFSSLEPLRPLLVLLAVGLLVHAFVRAYRRAPPGVGTPAPVHARRSVLWGGAAVCAGLLALGLPWASDTLAQATSGARPAGAPAASASDAQLVLAVEGADCASCLIGVRRALEKLPGVTALEAGKQPHQLRVRYVAAQVAPAAILQAAQAKSDLPVRIEG